MKPQPLVSVVTPAYNEEKHVAECLESIIAQTYQNWECIVVNNCSTDATGGIARRYAAKDSRIRVVDNEKLLPAVRNFNEALRKMSTAASYCKVVFADDWIFPECIERMVEVAEESPTIGIVGAYGLQGQRVMWQGVPFPGRRIPGREICRKMFLEDVYVFGSATSVLYRADLVRNSDRFFNESHFHGDMETAVQLMGNNDFGFVHQVLTYSRPEEPGCLRKVSSDLESYSAAWFYLLALYGRAFLNDEEFRARMSFYRKQHYAALAGGFLRAREKSFWDYHKRIMADAGIDFSRVHLAQVIFLKLLIASLNPGALIRKCWEIGSQARARRRMFFLADGGQTNG
jgi:glycosyltransferase involved in cell wall biosynthesis